MFGMPENMNLLGLAFNMNAGPISNLVTYSCADQENFVSGNLTLTLFLFYLYYIVDDKGRERIKITIKVGHYQPTKGTPFKLCLLAG